MTKLNSEALLEKYYNLTATAEERALVEAWYLQNKEQELPDPQHLIEDHFLIKDAILRHARSASKKGIHGVRRIAAAAIFLLLSSSILYYFLNVGPNNNNVEFTKDIPAGKNGGSLILPNGRVIKLSNSKNGVVIAADLLSYDDKTPVEDIKKAEIEEYLSNAKQNESLQLATAKGQTYQLTLPDGTNVWLNASSKLIFPASFNGQTQRRVELEGEGYFEVSKSKTRPFVVITKKQEIKVLGTHFNIHAYETELKEVTTLAEGSVRINTLIDEQLLAPNFQATVLTNRKIELAAANLKYNLAWKNGFFRFNQDDITEIMRRISRWYDIDVIYEGEISQEKFSGTISSSKNISQVLKMLSYSQDIKFKIEGRRVTVRK